MVYSYGHLPNDVDVVTQQQVIYGVDTSAQGVLYGQACPICHPLRESLRSVCARMQAGRQVPQGATCERGLGVQRRVGCAVQLSPARMAGGQDMASHTHTLTLHHTWNATSNCSQGMASKSEHALRVATSL